MKRLSLLFTALFSVLFFSCDRNKVEPYQGISMRLLPNVSYTESKPESAVKADFSYTTEPMKLYFYGVTPDEDYPFKVEFPQDASQYRAAYLTYTMCGWNEGPAEWDMTTIVRIKNKKDGKWYEFARAFTPYGWDFGPDWEKTYYMNITEFLPLMEGSTDFSLYYCGWDNTDKRAHALKLGFDFYKGIPERKTIFTAKVYDSHEGSMPAYRRCWPYGVEGWDIEDESRLGERKISIPAGVRSAEVRVDITGHGMDPGFFPDRYVKQANNAAEFDSQTYRVKFNGVELKQTGYVFEPNSDNYPQAGTYRYDRAGWGPGKPANVHYWVIENIPENGAEITLDIDFERFVSKINNADHDSNAYYIISADIYGFDK